MMAEKRDLLQGVCRDFEQDLILYLYQDCTATERRRVESHLVSCASCRHFLEELQRFLPATVKADEPSPAFWRSYSQEIQAKLTAAEVKRDWWRAISDLFRPWPVPAISTALVLALALTLTFTKGRWPFHQTRPQEKEFVEMASVTDNLDFFNSFDFLDSMDLLEAVEGKELQNSETSHQPL